MKILKMENFQDPFQAFKSNQKYELRGGSPVAYLGRKPEAGSCLLGNRYLTRRSGLFWIAPAGQGKSTAAMQGAVCWACARAGFEIEATFPLRITMVQAEDDDADLIDQTRVIEWLGFSPAERDLVGKNVWIETVNDRVGVSAVTLFDEILAAKPCDIFILNPYTAYLGADSKDEEANSIFLRARIQFLLNKHNCAALIIHHTPKTNFRSNTEKWSVTDWMYSGAGTAVLANWARAILAIDPVGETGVFKFIAAKRHQRIGWASKINYFKHDDRPGVLLWTKATAVEISRATGHAGHEVTKEQVLEAVPVLDGISMMSLRAELEKTTSQRGAKNAIDLAIDAGIIHAEWVKGTGHAGRIKMIFRGGEDLLNATGD
jgi:AAA domain